MSRETLFDSAAAVLLAGGALAVALPFRAEALIRTPVVSLGWDAALHATEGLDLFDELRLGRVLDALSLLVSRHWWGPVWAFVSAPFQAAFGPSLAAASLPSLTAFVLVPSAAFLLARRLAPASGPLFSVLTGVVTGCLFLRSPMLLEMSAWPMLESLGGLLPVVSFLLFSRRNAPSARRAAFVVGALAFLLKYHFGFFVLATLGCVVAIEEEPGSRKLLFTWARGLLLKGVGSGILALACLLAAVRLVLEARGGDALARSVPSVSNVAWGTFALLVAVAAVRRRSLAEAWSAASGALRDFVLFGVLPCAVWCLDPANVRAWYRQVFPPAGASGRDPLARLAAFWGFLREDYTIGTAAAGLVSVGLLLAFALPGDRTRRALAAFAIWPVALMSLSAYPLEARFFACLAPALFAAAASGLAAGASRLGEGGRRGAALAAAAVILVLGRDEARWRRATASRAAYRFSYSPAETAAIEAAVASAPAAGPIRLRLPADPPVWPTVRLALRLSRRDVAPVDVSVVPGP